jgi:hypothetical protein
MDGISSLPDDLLHAVLTFLGDTPAAVTRTAALSRRWRHVWTGARNLTFKDSDTHPETNRPSSQQRLAGFVDWVLARRGDSNNSMDSLKIQFTAERGQQQGGHASASPEQVSEWLRYACQHVVKSVEIDLGQRTGERPRDEQRRQEVVVKVPSHGRAESISLRLPNHRFQLLQADPAAAGGARYEALTKLELFRLSFAGDGDLGDFVSSSCCPRLRRLQIASPDGLRRLSLRSHALEELLISSASDLETLDVATPNLRLFDMLWCFTRRKVYDDCDEYIDGTTGNKIIVRVVAPRLEEIVNMRYVREQPADLDIRGLASVRRLSELQLNMHGKYHVDTDVGFWLLENCPGVEHVQVWLNHMRCSTPAVDNRLVDLTWAAPLARVRSLCVRASCYLKDDFVASMSSLLFRCPHLTSLSVDLGASSLSPSTWACFCDAVPDKLEIRGKKVALESLEEVEMTGFGGTQEEMQLVALLFESSSSSIKRMALVQLHALVVKRKKAMGEQRPDVETIRRELMKIPYCAHLGRWRLSQNTFTWTRN